MSFLNDPTHPEEYGTLAFDLNFTSATICIWVKTATQGMAVASTTAAGMGVGRDIFLAVETGTGLGEAYVYDGAERHVIGTTIINDDKWHHLALVSVNSGFLRLYVDGVEEGTAITVGTVVQAADRFHLGQGGGGTSGAEGFLGELADFRAYNTALTVKQIKILASGYDLPLGDEQGQWTMENIQNVAHPEDQVLTSTMQFLDETGLTSANIIPVSSPRSKAAGVNPRGYRVSSVSMADMYLETSQNITMALDVALVNEDE